MEKTTVLEFLQQNKSDIEKGLAAVEFRRFPAGLYDPVAYILKSQGKRLRPQLVLATASVFAGDRSAAIQVGVAMEVFHIFTLVHDDIMDRSGSRRGRETIHVKWDEPTAILVGDYLQGLATELLLSLPDHSLKQGLVRFTQTVRELCEGQIRDMEFESDSRVDLESYLTMIDQKTSALLKTSLVMGAMTGKVTPSQIEMLDEIGYHLGRAFQIQDDLLDLTATSEDWGKPIGGDLISGKKAFLLLEAIRLETRSGDRFFHDVADRGGLPGDQIELARAKLDQMGVLESARKAVEFHSGSAISLADHLPESVGKQSILSLIQKMAQRAH
jgi:geranylgeranyl diphosphate synthase type II